MTHTELNPCNRINCFRGQHCG